ncbi:MAG: putative iron-regulated rane protein [Labilithrix sp.]|nr:putative iron-regulated rane protein [Labilithrix sp.]
MKASSVKTWHWVHKWTSLVCTVFALLLCVTGLPLIFTHAIDHALGNTVDLPVLSEAGGHGSIDDMVGDALKRRPGHAVQFVSQDDDEPNRWYVRMGETVNAPRASAVFAYDGRTGRFVNEYPLDQGVMNVLIRLHIDMFAGIAGTLFLGAMGLVLVASMVSGVVIYGPYMQKLAFGALRRRRSARILWLDIHNLLGMVTLGWFMVVTATGVINTLATPIFARWQATHLTAMIDPYRSAAPATDTGSDSPQRALDAALAHVPDTELGFMAFPGNDFAGPRHFVAFLRGNTPWRAKLLTPVLMDAQTGRVLESRELPLYVSALLVSQPLHFGDYGGTPLKIVWALLDILSIIVLGSGVYLWLRKRNVSFETWRQSLTAAEDAASGGAA